MGGCDGLTKWFGDLEDSCKIYLSILMSTYFLN